MSIIGKSCYLTIRGIFYFFFKILFRLEVHGIENVSSLKKPFILASNHESYLDPPILGVASPKILWYVAKKSLFEIFFFGKFISFVGALPVNLKRINLNLVRKIYRLMENNQVLVVFPEGTRSDKGIREGLPGIGYLMDKTKAPVVPVYIEGSGNALPISAFFIRAHKVRVYFGKPLTYNKVKEKVHNSVTKRQRYRLITKIIMDCIKELAKMKESSYRNGKRDSSI